MKMIFKCLLIPLALYSCGSTNIENKMDNQVNNNQKQDLEQVIFGAGCFWCVEAIFENIQGVESVESGYSGGSVDNPTYKDVCSGITGHAEVCQITYDPEKISFSDLLEAFWQTHDPTTLNRQGNDVGTMYRSAIFFQTEQQRELAEKYKAELDASGAWPDPIVTEITPVSKFYKADDSHQDYYSVNEDAPYCQFVIKPKLEKFIKVFGDKLKQD